MGPPSPGARLSSVRGSSRSTSQSLRNFGIRAKGLFPSPRILICRSSLFVSHLPLGSLVGWEPPKGRNMISLGWPGRCFLMGALKGQEKIAQGRVEGEARSSALGDGPPTIRHPEWVQHNSRPDRRAHFRAPMIHWDRNPGRRCGALPLRSALG